MPLGRRGAPPSGRLHPRHSTGPPFTTTRAHAIGALSDADIGGGSWSAV